MIDHLVFVSALVIVAPAATPTSAPPPTSATAEARPTGGWYGGLALASDAAASALLIAGLDSK